MPPIRPWNSQSRGSSDGVSDRQKNSVPKATPTKSSRTRLHAQTTNGWRVARVCRRRFAGSGWAAHSPEQSGQHALRRAAQFVETDGELALDLDGRRCLRRPRRCARRAVRGPRTWRGTGSPRCAARRPAPGPPTRRTARRTDPHPSGSTMRQPVSPASADSTTAWMSPPSDRSCAAEISPSRDAETSTSASSCSRARSTLGGRPPRWSAVTCAQTEPSNSSWVSPSRISVSPGSVPKAGRDASVHVVDDAEHADHRGRQDRAWCRSGCRSSRCRR